MTIRLCTREELPLVHAHAQKGLDAGELYVAERDGDIVGTMICLHRQGDTYRSVRWAAEYDVPVMARAHEQGLRAIRLDTTKRTCPPPGSASGVDWRSGAISGWRKRPD